MSLLSWAALTVGLIAVIAMAFGLADVWFFGLLALACMLGCLDAAYRELKPWAWAFLILGATLGALSLRAAYLDSRAGRDGT